MGTVAEAAESGSRREILEAVRDRLAASIDNEKTPPRDLAALTRRFLDVTREIEALADEESEDEVGEAQSTPDEDFDPDAS